MEPLPDKPAGCEITDAADANGVTLRWPAYKADAQRAQFGDVLGVGAWLCFWTIGGVVAIWALASGRGHPLAIVWLGGWAVGEVAGAWFLLTTFRPVLPEHVRLEAARLSYFPGRGPDAARSCAELPDGKVVPVCPGPAVAVPKAAIQEFGIDHVNERQRLYFDTEGRRVEIGGCLTGSERAWLLTVLQMWLGEPLPRWSRGTRKSKEETQA